MAYRVDITRRAEADLEELCLWVVDRAPQQGARWFNGLERAVLSLDQHPTRCPVAPESFDLDHPAEYSCTDGGRTRTAFSSRLITMRGSCACCTCGGARGNGPSPRNWAKIELTFFLAYDDAHVATAAWHSPSLLVDDHGYHIFRADVQAARLLDGAPAPRSSA